MTNDDMRIVSGGHPVDPRAEAAEARLAEVTKERDRLSELLADAYGAVLDWDEVLKQRSDAEAIRRAEAAEAANLRFYRAGIEAASRIVRNAGHSLHVEIDYLPDPTDKQIDAIRKGGK